MRHEFATMPPVDCPRELEALGVHHRVVRGGDRRLHVLHRPVVARRQHDPSPLDAHLLAIAAVLFEILTRSWKIQWSAKAAHIELQFMTALRTTLAGDFGASITPARSGAEPARFLVLAESGIETSSALVVLFAELFLESLSLATVVLVVAIVFRHAGFVLKALVGVVGVYAGFVIGVGVIAVVLARRHVDDTTPPWAHPAPTGRQAMGRRFTAGSRRCARRSTGCGTSSFAGPSARTSCR